MSVDLDYFTVTVPAGQVLAALNVLPGTVGAGAIGSFIAIYSGSTAVNPVGASSTDALGYYLYRAADIGTDILDNMATFNFNGTNPSIGFIPPLSPGAYTFWIQEGFNGTFPYNFELVLNSVPEPSTALLMVAGLAMFLRRHRREFSLSFIVRNTMDKLLSALIAATFVTLSGCAQFPTNTEATNCGSFPSSASDTAGPKNC